MENYIEVQNNIGINCKEINCMVVHPSEMHMIYAAGALLIIKSIDSEQDRYLKGHYSVIN